MIVVMRPGYATAELDRVVAHVEEAGLQVHLSVGEEHAIVGVIGVPITDQLQEALEVLPGVEQVLRVTKRYKLASRDFHPEPTRIAIGDATIGGDAVAVIAGPCSVESEEQFMTTARALREAGVAMLRGGAFKPRTSPYEFRGLGERGLQIMAAARAETGLPIVTEVMAAGDVDLVASYADVLQIGARNSQNYLLLEAAGASGKPVLLKRGMSVTIEEWLLAAEYVMASGSEEVILCERGIRTFETATRNTLDLSAVPAVKKLSHLPVIIDPSHGTGKADLVPAMALAAVAAGADGLMIEVHPNPDQALSDGAQSLDLAQFADLMPRLEAVAQAVGRRVGARAAV
ncbi:MAG TPA: 3-deoxy-7-phosphoheptulonate synthase [Thermomicrobiales bacterium]|nr:3-deoxy-7-phosphoheptulonate synthase [Thermomicrobiales bacterium]